MRPPLAAPKPRHELITEELREGNAVGVLYDYVARAT
jgi:hypothetical protein